MRNRVRELADGVFGRRGHLDRVIAAEDADFGARIVISCDHRGPIRASELVALADAFGVMPEAVEVWDVGLNRIEVRVDLDALTPPARPCVMISRSGSRGAPGSTS